MPGMTNDANKYLEKRASFFRAVSAVTPGINEELDERTRRIFHEEYLKMHPSSPKKPSTKGTHKLASVLPFLDSFFSETKLANMAGVSAPSTVSSSKSLIPRSTLKASPKYTQVNPSTPGSPAQQHQPVLGSPPVRG